MTYIMKTEAIAALSPAHVAGYLRSRGWQDGGRFGSYGQRYFLDINDTKTELVIPRESSISDFTRRMTEVIEILAETEQRDVALVLFDLTLTPFDIVRVRALDADSYGSIGLEQGLQLHEEAKRLIAAAAAASVRPRRAFKGRRPESVSQYLDHVRLGQTENASFSLTLLSPYSFDPAGSDLLQDDAFGRRVTKTFRAALSAIGQALADAVGDPIPAFERGVSCGVSAELCQSLAKLADNKSGAEVSIGWSPAKPVDTHSKLRLSRENAAVLREVARHFSRQEPDPDFVLEGPIEEIRSKPYEFDGQVVVQATLPNHVRVRKFRVRFDERYRSTVYDAAKARKWIRVIGDLYHEGKYLRLAEPRDFSIIEFEEDAENTSTSAVSLIDEKSGQIISSDDHDDDDNAILEIDG